MTTFTPDTARAFYAYFDVADETSDPDVTIGDLACWMIDDARNAADEFGLPWPPNMTDAENFALDNRAALDAALA